MGALENLNVEDLALAQHPQVHRLGKPIAQTAEVREGGLGEARRPGEPADVGHPLGPETVAVVAREALDVPAPLEGAQEAEAGGLGHPQPAGDLPETEGSGGVAEQLQQVQPPVHHLHGVAIRPGGCGVFHYVK